MFEVSCMDEQGVRFYYSFNNYFTACIFAMGMSELGMADVIDAETGEVIRIYHLGTMTYLAEGWD